MPESADTRDRTRDLQIFSLTLSQLSYIGEGLLPQSENQEGRPSLAQTQNVKGGMGELNPRPLLP